MRMASNRLLRYHEFGDPAAVVRLETADREALPADSVRVRMLGAPINPADLNTIEGTYAFKPPLPAIPGGEGVGEVIEIGAEATGCRVGDWMLAPYGVGTWREEIVAPAEKLLPVSRDLPVDQVAMLKVNPATAMRMLLDFVELTPGEWVLQNAANSGVGRAVIQIARALGWRTVNVVRRPELVEELKAEGVDVVLVDGDDLPERVKAATAGAGIRLALNAVGGESALHLANSVAPGATIVTYGAMGRKPLRIPNGLLIFKDLRWRGFWVTHWYEKSRPAEHRGMLEQLSRWTAEGKLRFKVEQTFPLEKAAEAIARAKEGGRAGKILLRFD
jgi:trans-2-enoyl-CoA reductase